MADLLKLIEQLEDIPVVLRVLQQNPLLKAVSHEGDVLESVLKIDTSFWQQHSAVKLEVQQILLDNIYILSQHSRSIEFRQLSKKLDVYLPIMSIKELITAIKQKHARSGIIVHAPAREAELREWEKRTGFSLPGDFRELYSSCNGFECTEDIFNLTPLREIEKYDLPNGKNGFELAEYMIRSDLWYVRKKGDNSKYEISNSQSDAVLTDSLQEFLERFLRGGVFETGGLYDWQEEIKRKGNFY
jgi:hypothetical protein